MKRLSSLEAVPLEIVGSLMRGRDGEGLVQLLLRHAVDLGSFMDENETRTRGWDDDLRSHNFEQVECRTKEREARFESNHQGVRLVHGQSIAWCAPSPATKWMAFPIRVAGLLGMGFLPPYTAYTA